MTEKFANNLVMTLDGGIDDTQATLTVVSPTGCPATGDFRLAVGPPGGPYELMLGTSRSGSVITVTRHIEGTTAVTHDDGEDVRLVLTAAVLTSVVAALVPSGGANGTLLGKTGSGDYALGWVVGGGPTGPTGATGATGPGAFIAEMDGSPFGTLGIFQVPAGSLQSPATGAFNLSFLHALFGTDVILENDLAIGAPIVNRALSGAGATASASSTGSGSASNVIDGDDGTGIVTNAPVANQWLRVNLTANRVIAGCRIIQNDDGSHTASDVLIESSLNGTTWTAQTSTAITAPDSGYVEFDNGPVLARYWRVTAAVGGGSGWDVKTIQLVAPGSFGRLGRGGDGGVITARFGGTVEYSDAHLPAWQTCFHDESLVDVGGDIVTAVDPAQRHNLLAEQDTPADGDEFHHTVVMKAGYYNLTVVGKTDADCGKIDWAFDPDGPVIVGQDWYSVAGVDNVEVVSANFYNYIPGRRRLKGIVNGKNGSSSGFRIALTKFTLREA